VSLLASNASDQAKAESGIGATVVMALVPNAASLMNGGSVVSCRGLDGSDYRGAQH